MPGDKHKSKLFEEILEKVCTGKLKEPFGSKDKYVDQILRNNPSFLSKHSTNEKGIYDKKKKKGYPYFMRVERGCYMINPLYKNCK